jgi:hypothetical protein
LLGPLVAITPAIELKKRENSAIRPDQSGKRVDCASGKLWR